MKLPRIPAILLSLLPVAAVAAHGWCGSVEPGKGLLLQRLAKSDRMCGWIQARYDGDHVFTANVPGSRVWIGRKLVTGPTSLEKDRLYAIVIEAPKSEDFRLSWDRPLGVAMEIPPTALYQPTQSLVEGCPLPEEVLTPARAPK